MPLWTGAFAVVDPDRLGPRRERALPAVLQADLRQAEPCRSRSSRARPKKCGSSGRPTSGSSSARSSPCRSSGRPARRCSRTRWQKWLKRAPRPMLASAVFFAIAYIINHSGKGVDWQLADPGRNMVNVLAKAAAAGLRPALSARRAVPRTARRVHQRLGELGHRHADEAPPRARARRSALRDPDRGGERRSAAGWPASSRRPSCRTRPPRSTASARRAG